MLLNHILLSIVLVLAPMQTTVLPKTTVFPKTTAMKATSGGVTPTFVQQTGTNSQTNSIAFVSNVTSGNALYAIGFCGSGASCVGAFSSTHESWSSPQASVALSGDGDVVFIGCAIATGTQADTITATGDGVGGNIESVIIEEWSGATCTLDTTTSPSGGFSTTNSTNTAIPSVNITTTTNNDVMIVATGGSTGGSGTSNWTAASGYSNSGCTTSGTRSFTCTGAVGDNPTFGTASKLFATAGTTSGTIVTSGSNSIEYAVVLVVFKSS